MSEKKIPKELAKRIIEYNNQSRTGKVPPEFRNPTSSKDAPPTVGPLMCCFGKFAELLKSVYKDIFKLNPLNEENEYSVRDAKGKEPNNGNDRDAA